MNIEFVKQRLATLTLDKDEVKLIAVRPVDGDRADVQLVFAEKVETNTRSSNRLLSKVFGANNIQPAWESVTLDFIKEHLPTALEPATKAIAEKDYQSLDISNPTFEGEPLRIEIVETTKATEWQRANLEKGAKQDGDGNYLHDELMRPIFRDTFVVVGEPNHLLIPHTGMVTDVHSLDMSDVEGAPAGEAMAQVAQSQQKEVTA